MVAVWWSFSHPAFPPFAWFSQAGTLKHCLCIQNHFFDSGYHCEQITSTLYKYNYIYTLFKYIVEKHLAFKCIFISEWHGDYEIFKFCFAIYVVLKVCPFELFPDAGPVYVTIEEQTLMRSDERDAKESLENIGRFHCYLFSVVLRKPLTSVPDCYNGYYVVLLNEQKGRYKIDLAQMERFVASSDKPKLFRRRAASNPTEGQVVVPLHSSAGKRTDGLGGGAYRVVKVCHDMSPLSRFPDQSRAKTFEEYYRNEYQKTVTNMEQPLVQVCDAVTARNKKIQ